MDKLFFNFCNAVALGEQIILCICIVLSISFAVLKVAEV